MASPSSIVMRSLLDVPQNFRRLLGSALLLTIALLIVRRWYIKYSEKRYCAYGDLKVAGDPIPQQKKKKCAVIVGASISGILSGTYLPKSRT